jgi:hypothetical protein
MNFGIRSGKKRLLFYVAFIALNFYGAKCYPQGRAYNWLLGSQNTIDTFTTSAKARMLFDSTSVSVIPESRKMAFNSAQANISDESGNLLVATNGCWIANAIGDTMLNGGGLNPSPFTITWCDSSNGIPYPYADVILPWPGDSTKYVLFHQTSDDPDNFRALNLFYTKIDLALDGGLGGIDTTQKNISIVQDKLCMGIGACKHANGRDWWIVTLRDSSDLIHIILLTPWGITSITTQNLGFPLATYQSGQLTFSPDGNRFCYSTLSGTVSNATHDVRILDFDRCTGIFSNPILFDITDTYPGYGYTFSPNSEYIYATSFLHVFQVNIDSAIVDTVATYDNYTSPNPPFYTLFYTMYRASDGKIYISTANGTVDLHYINFPDSASISCDVQQHALHLPCYQYRADVNHPNYYLGPVIGSICDSLHVGINEIGGHDFNFSVSPNPVNAGYLKVKYFLPQNKSGWFVIYDAVGREVYRLPIPQWSTLQEITLLNLATGIYNAVIYSGTQRVNKKLAVIR